MAISARALAAVLLAAGLGAVPARGGATAQDDDLRAARTRGSATAPLTIYDMSDFQCPACAIFVRGTLPALEREYVATGKVRLVFVNFPLPMHPNAEPAAELAMCAARQGKFWRMHDVLYRTQERWAELGEPGAFFLALGDSAGVDRTQLAHCVRSRATRDLVKTDAEGAIRSGAHSTPSFYIEGGQRPGIVSGALPIEALRPILDSIIRAKAGR